MRAILFFAMFSFPYWAYSQNYIPLLDNTNEWQLIYCNGADCMTDTYHTDGDTIAFGKQYKILDGYHYISRKFLLREEVQSKKVFLNAALNNQSNEYLLYDFSLNEGDEFRMMNPISPFPEDLGYFKVDSIRLKPTNENQNSRFFYFSPSESNEEGFGYLPVWVEGMGSLSLINAPGGNPDYYGVGQIGCFWKNTNLFYHDNTMESDCQKVFATKDTNKSQVRFVMTNQKMGLFTHTENVQKLSIFDSSGKLFKQISNQNQSTIQIEMNQLPKGVYFVKLIENNFPIYLSFVKK